MMIQSVDLEIESHLEINNDYPEYSVHQYRIRINGELVEVIPIAKNFPATQAFQRIAEIKRLVANYNRLLENLQQREIESRLERSSNYGR